MTSIYPLHLAALAASLFLASCATTTLRSFEGADADKDGAVSREEATGSEDLSSLFTSADDDKDGVLNEEEYELARRVILGSRQSSGRPSRGHSAGGGGGHSH